MKHILCYGDSNTWGFQPGFGGRYPRQRRWTGVAEGLLGDGYVLLENGLNGRTTDFDDPELPYRNGRKGFAYAMVSQKPIDLLILMLGTNDLKFTTAEGSRDGLASILEEALHPEIHFPSGSTPVYTGKPRVLLLSPIRMRPGTVFDRPCGGPKDPAAESARFAPLFRALAEERGVDFLDAAAFAGPSRLDGVHMGPEAHEALGRAVADKVRAIFAGEA